MVEFLYNANLEKLSAIADDLRGFGSATGYLRLRVEPFEAISDNPAQFVLITSARPDDSFECHACFPTLSIALIGFHDHQWQFETFNPQLSKGGEWGNAPIAKVVEIGAGGNQDKSIESDPEVSQH